MHRPRTSSWLAVAATLACHPAIAPSALAPSSVPASSVAPASLSTAPASDAGATSSAVARPGASTNRALSLGVLLERHRQAMGGTALSQLQSVRVDGVIDYPDDAWRFVADRRRPNELRLAAYHGDSLISAEGFTGTTAWSSAPGTAACALSTSQGASIQRDAEFFSPLLSAAPDGATLELVGSTRVDDAEAYDIHVTRGDGFESDYLVDATSYLLLRKREVRSPRAGGPAIPIETAYYDYRPVAGVLYPFVTVEREQADGKLISVTVLKRVEPNSVDAAAMAPACAAKS